MEDKVPLVSKEKIAPAPNGFNEKAQWHLVDEANLETLNDIRSEFEGAYAPSDRMGEKAKARKYNYQENWSRKTFDGVAMQPVKDSEGNLERNRHEEVKYEKQLITALTLDYAFIKKHKLDRYVATDVLFCFLI